MPNYRRIVRSSPAYEAPDITSAIIFNLEAGQVVEVLSEEHATYTQAKHLGQPVYIAREDTVHAAPEESAVTQPVAAPAYASTAAPAAATGFCPQCGGAVEAGERYCRNCGATLITGGVAEWERAGFWIRFGAYFIDYIIVTVANTLFSLFIFGGEALFFIGLAGSILIPIAYYVIGYGMGTTLGCAAFSLRIETEDGAEPGYGRGFIRWFISIFSALVLGLGYFWMIWDPKKQTWHDKAAGTVVVRR
jgi:uncharacterized RDD family membrane protein YckC